MSEIGLIGTGVKGRPMAQHLQAGGREPYPCQHRSAMAKALEVSAKQEIA
jgi:3-hydroxyisobutyrate dehydrogenase-like beta-hydroxyacid dehydrogenase